MSLFSQIFNETIEIERPGPPVRDSTGSVVPGPSTRFSVEYCAVIPPYGVTIGSSTETHDASTTVETRRVLFAPLGTDVCPADRVLRANGERWEVVGRPNVLGATSLAHVEAALKEVTG
ncbi:hypothetical protein [Streptomyces silvensis]|uniref:Phage head-tail adapter protein n=1 Tax=Streptomyces silvensis TaxID=1765722 RepID=A0A0W7X814_9ACTN|nr:hypothetical protein [Streptomyces silvensis]KUF18871.1 hypothetical protein AT728_07505 [Streptomyces silvensis]